jgi:hypothetical protein
MPLMLSSASAYLYIHHLRPERNYTLPGHSNPYHTQRHPFGTGEMSQATRIVLCFFLSLYHYIFFAFFLLNVDGLPWAAAVNNDRIKTDCSYKFLFEGILALPELRVGCPRVGRWSPQKLVVRQDLHPSTVQSVPTIPGACLVGSPSVIPVGKWEEVRRDDKDLWIGLNKRWELSSFSDGRLHRCTCLTPNTACKGVMLS